MDRLICTWLDTLLDAHAGIGLALDGKTVRNTRPGTGLDVQLFSAMRHDTAVVIAQVQVPTDTTEVTQITALLDPIDITGMTITADAGHPSHDTAKYPIKRKAGYVFTVKGNRPGLLTAITVRLPQLCPTSPPRPTPNAATATGSPERSRPHPPPVSTSPAPPRSSGSAATFTPPTGNASANTSCTASPT